MKHFRQSLNFSRKGAKPAKKVSPQIYSGASGYFLENYTLAILNSLRALRLCVKPFFAIGLILTACNAMGQDIHFSQFYNSPLTLNPALTGKINGTFRIAAIYRDQWFGGTGGVTYSTPSISFDMPIRLKNGDAVGIGVNLLNDETKGGLYSRIEADFSAAYHKAIGANKNHSLSFGVQLAYIQRRLDVANIKLASQLDDNNLLNSSIPSGENLPGTTNNFDVNTGVMWNSRVTSKVDFYVGVSGFNLIQPISTFSGSSDNMRRLTVNGGTDIRLTTHFSLLPSIIYMREATAQETNLGVAGGIDATSDFIFYIGAYYRVKDAFIPYVGADYKGFRVGLSYDAAVSTQWEGLGKVNGSFEISLIYVGRYIPLPNVKPALYCPRF